MPEEWYQVREWYQVVVPGQKSGTRPEEWYQVMVPGQKSGTM